MFDFAVFDSGVFDAAAPVQAPIQRAVVSGPDGVWSLNVKTTAVWSGYGAGRGAAWTVKPKTAATW